MARLTLSATAALCILFILSVADGVPLRTSTCPSMCVCRHTAKRADCRDIPEWNLKMSDAQVVRISPPAHRVEPGPLFLSRLDSFPKVQMLSITNRSFIELIPGALPYLQVLDLSNNKLSRFSERTFHHTPALRKLTLEGNPISLQKGIPLLTSSTIRTLDLSHCGLSQIPGGSLDGIPLLTSLYLQGNPLKLEENVPLVDRPSIQELDLSLCKLTRIPLGSLDNLVHLRRLFLRGNDLKTISPGEIPPSVHILDLSANRIRDPPMDVLSGMRNLTTLELANNPLRCTCTFISFLDRLSEHNVIFEKMILCAEPQKYAKVFWKDINEGELCKDDIASEESNDTSSSSDGSSATYSFERDDNSYETDVNPDEENRIINQHAPPFLLNGLLQKQSRLQNMEENSIQGDQPYSNTSDERSDYMNDAPVTTPDHHHSEDTTENTKDDLIIPESTESDDYASKDVSLPKPQEKNDDLIVAVADDHEKYRLKSQKDRELLEDDEEQKEDLRKAPDASVAVDEEPKKPAVYEDKSVESTENPDSETFMRNADTIAMGKSMPGKEEAHPSIKDTEKSTDTQNKTEPVLLASRTESESLQETGNETTGSEDTHAVLEQSHDNAEEHRAQESEDSPLYHVEDHHVRQDAENRDEPATTLASHETHKQDESSETHVESHNTQSPSESTEIYHTQDTQDRSEALETSVESHDTHTHSEGLEAHAEDKHTDHDTHHVLPESDISTRVDETSTASTESHESEHTVAITEKDSSHSESDSTEANGHDTSVTSIYDTSSETGSGHDEASEINRETENVSRDGEARSLFGKSEEKSEEEDSSLMKHETTESLEHETTSNLGAVTIDSNEHMNVGTEHPTESTKLPESAENALEGQSNGSEGDSSSQSGHESGPGSEDNESRETTTKVTSSESIDEDHRSTSETEEHKSGDATEENVNSSNENKSEVHEIHPASEESRSESGQTEEKTESVEKHAGETSDRSESPSTTIGAIIDTHSGEKPSPTEATISPSVHKNEDDDATTEHHDTTTESQDGFNFFSFNFLPSERNKDRAVSEPAGVHSESEHNEDLTAESNMARISDTEGSPVEKTNEEGDAKMATLAYALIGALIVCIIIAVACVSFRTRSDNKRNGAAPVRIRGDTMSPGTEMKDMMNPLLGPVTEGQTANEFQDDAARRSSLTSVELNKENGKFPVISPVSKKNGISSDKRKSEGSDIRAPDGPHSEAEVQPLNSSSLNPRSVEEPDKTVTEVVGEAPASTEAKDSSPSRSHRNGVSTSANGKPLRQNGTTPSKVKIKESVIPPAIPRIPVYVQKIGGED